MSNDQMVKNEWQYTEAFQTYPTYQGKVKE